MNRDFAVLPPVATVQEAVEAMMQCGCGTVIVDRADEGDAYGILTFQEIVYRVVAKSLSPTRTRIGDVMIKPLIVVNPSLRLPFVAQLFARSASRMPSSSTSISWRGSLPAAIWCACW